jgi:hypothetical protein
MECMLEVDEAGKKKERDGDGHGDGKKRKRYGDSHGDGRRIVIL